jgi:hypothetical protein
MSAINSLPSSTYATPLSVISSNTTTVLNPEERFTISNGCFVFTM